MTEAENLRRAFVLSRLPTARRGIEIAPYFNPIVDKKNYDVLYVDCIDNDEIQRKASGNPGAIDRKVPRIDAVWMPGSALKDCIQNETLFYAVASHVFEHVPNPLGWLQQILDCLVPGSLIALLLPNRERSMDYYRSPTSFAQLIGWQIENPSKPTAVQVMDFLSQSFEDNGTVDFDTPLPSFPNAKRHYSDTDAIRFAEFVVQEDHYLDVHCSVWTPDSFVDVFSRVIAAGRLNVDLIGPFTGFSGAARAEFLVYLRKHDESPGQ